MSVSKKGVIGVCGSGMIGTGWAIVFAAAGYQVNLYDLSKEQLSIAMKDIEDLLHNMKENDMLRGNLSVEEQLALIKGVDSLLDCVSGACYIQECIPERLQMKTELFEALDRLVEADTILASSTSSFSPSGFTAGLLHKENCIVSHPINPPHYIRLVEIVPAPWTSKQTRERTRSLMQEVGQAPITFSREIPGFGVNRIQLSIMNEAHQLVTNGYLSAADVDTILKEGLAMKYVWQGPFETAHIAANGLADTIRHFGPAFMVMNQTFESAPIWDEENSKEILNQINGSIPLDQLQDRRSWRDERLAALAKLKEEMGKLEEQKQK